MVKGACEKAVNQTLGALYYPFGYMHVISADSGHLDYLTKQRVKDILTPNMRSINNLDARMLERHRMTWYMQAMEKRSQHKKHSETATATDKELESFLTPTITVQRAVRSYTSMSISMTGFNLHLVGQIRSLANEIVAARDDESLITWTEDGIEKLKCRIPMVVAETGILILGLLVDSEQQATIPSAVTGNDPSYGDESLSDRQLCLIKRFAGDNVIHLFSTLLRRLVLLLSTFSKHAQKHDPAAGMHPKQRAMLEEAKDQLDAFARLGRLDLLLRSEIPLTLRAVLAAVPVEKQKGVTEAFASELCAALEVEDVRKELTTQCLMPPQHNHLKRWFQHAGRPIVSIGMVRSKMDATATRHQGRCLTNIFPKSSRYLPSQILDAVLSGNVDVNVALSRADVACNIVTATLQEPEEPFELEDGTGSRIRRLAAAAVSTVLLVTAVPALVMVGGVTVVAVVGGAATLGARGAANNGVDSPGALAAGGRAFDPRLYGRGAVDLARGAVDKLAPGLRRGQAAHVGQGWPCTVNLMLTLFGADTDGDAYDNQAILSLLLEKVRRRDLLEVVGCCRRRSQLESEHEHQEWDAKDPQPR